ncbi:CRISPR system single-strand-specific deoxyribonuclease Cas10/Csm1 (subtype III-A) [Candidatus Entotheonellaceae bacterium PAL068K]
MTPGGGALETLGALLHDIGKFRERTSESLPAWAQPFQPEAKYSHEPFSALFVEEWLGHWPQDLHTLRRLVLKHHNPDLPDEQVVSLADRLSANERAEAENNTEGARGRADSTLRTVLSRVELNGRGRDVPVYQQLCALSLGREVLFPDPEACGSADAYRRLWQAFTEEIRQAPPGDLTTLLALLRKYTWAIPSDTRYKTVPDVSLYHHLKTTAAIAACLVREGLTEQEVQTLLTALGRLYYKTPLSPSQADLVERDLCMLVKGDISGTQEFLYLLTSSGAARGLRGRSFYLQLLTEVMADWILGRLQLPCTNLLFAGGGHFYLLLPYSDTKQQLDNLRHEMAQKLWQLHRGDLSLTVDWAAVAPLDFLEGDAGGNAFASKWQEVSQKVNERKQRKWHDLGDPALLQDVFTPQQHGATAEDMCQVCHNEWRPAVDRLDDEVRKCRRCFGFEELGRDLRDPTHLVLFTVPESEPRQSPDWRDALRAFGTEARLLRTDDEVPRQPHGATTGRVYTLDSTDFLTNDVQQRFCWQGMPVSYDFRLLPNATPKRDLHGSIAEFSDLAEAADGVKWLGVLRMDVDRLGEVFRTGLGKQTTISRLSTLSESLRLFFEAWVPQVCRQYNRLEQGAQEQVYLVYAGGDDLFVVGAWSALPGVARQIQQDFHAFVGGNHVTLSGGIAIEHPKYPLYQLAHDAKHALDDQAKEFRRDSSGHPKDAVCFLQTTMGWEQFTDVAGWQNRLLNLLNPPTAGVPALPRGFLSRLIEIHALYAENARREKKLQRQGERTLAQMQEMIQYDRWRWRLTYQLSRFGDRYSDHQATINDLQHAILREPDGLITVLRLLARWTTLLTREG